MASLAASLTLIRAVRGIVSLYEDCVGWMGVSSLTASALPRMTIYTAGDCPRGTVWS